MGKSSLMFKWSASLTALIFVKLAIMKRHYVTIVFDKFHWSVMMCLKCRQKFIYAFKLIYERKWANFHEICTAVHVWFILHIPNFIKITWKNLVPGARSHTHTHTHTHAHTDGRMDLRESSRNFHNDSREEKINCVETTSVHPSVYVCVRVYVCVCVWPSTRNQFLMQFSWNLEYEDLTEGGSPVQISWKFAHLHSYINSKA